MILSQSSDVSVAELNEAGWKIDVCYQLHDGRWWTRARRIVNRGPHNDYEFTQGVSERSMDRALYTLALAARDPKYHRADPAQTGQRLTLEKPLTGDVFGLGPEPENPFGFDPEPEDPFAL